MLACIQCGSNIKKSGKKYCSNRCQADYQYNAYIVLWKNGKVNGSRGVRAKNISGHLRRYLAEKYGDKCSACEWSKLNPQTSKVPLEIDHIDGDADNNNADNLRLLCPNCHSLTPNFRNLNRGRGREWRRNKYIKIVV